MIFKKFKEEKYIMLIVVSFMVSVICAIYAILTRGQTVIHSDAATSFKLAKSIIDNHCLFPKEFAYNNGEFWCLSSHLVSIITVQLFDNMSLGRAFTSLLVVLIMVIVFRYSSKVLNSGCYLTMTCIVLIYMQNQSGFILYEVAYTPLLIMVVLELSLFLSIFDDDIDKKKLIIRCLVYGIILSYCCMAGVRYFSEITIPFLLGAVLFCLYNYYIGAEIKNIRIILLSEGVTLLSSSIGYFIYKWMSSWHTMNPSETTSLVFVDDVNDMWHNIGTYFQSFFCGFTFEGGVKVFSLQGICNLVGIVMTILLCYIVPILQLLKLKHETNKVKLLYAIMIGHNAVVFVVQAVAGLIVEARDARYLLSSAVILVLISTRYIHKYWFESTDKIINNTLAILFLLVTVIMASNLVIGCKGWKDELTSEKEFAYEITMYGVNKGYATYWNAYNNEIYSDGHLQIGAIKFLDEKVVVNNNLVDKSVYEEDDGNSFLILSEDENEKYYSRIEKTFGRPIDSFSKENVYFPFPTGNTYSTFYVYIFDHDIINEISDFFIDGKLTAKDLYFNGVGEIDEDSITVNQWGVLSGPYCTIERGEYTLRYVGNALNNGDYEVLSQSKANAYKYNIVEKKSDEVIIKLSVYEYINDIQIRTLNYSDKIISVDKILIEKE